MNPIRRLGQPRVHLQEVDSTNRVALEFAAEGAAEGLVVRAERQTGGRGRLDRTWHSPSGGLWLSVLLRPPRLEGLTLALGLAVVRTAALTGVAATLRWPNDVYAGERKLAGILVESRYRGHAPDCAVAGIGLNVNLQPADFPPGIRDSATSLWMERGDPVPLDSAEEFLLEQLESAYDRWLAGGFPALADEVARVCSTLDRRVRVYLDDGGSVEGRAVTLGADGGLVLEGGREFRSVQRVALL